jgi:hypothetical protein
MKIAILCPGPSIDRFPGRHPVDGSTPPDLVIGVNRAATRVACDVWASGDIWPLESPMLRVNHHVIGARDVDQGGGIPCPIWLTATETHEWAIRNNIRWPGEIRHFDQLKPGITSIDWTFYTLFAAIAYAVCEISKLPTPHSCPPMISIYGADWKGTNDFDGIEAGLTRDDNRWRTEREMFERLQEELAGRGIALHRIERSDPLYVGYFTIDTPYAQEADKLRQSLDRLHLPHELTGVPNLGSWQKNTQYKSRFIQQQLQQHDGRPLVYLDVDALVLRRPVLFNDLDCDLAFVRFNGEELLSGTVYFGNTPTCRKVVDRWVHNCQRFPDTFPPDLLGHYPNGEAAWDQRLLDLARIETPGVRCVELPQAYTYIEDLSRSRYPGVEPIILHTRGRSRLQHLIDR